MQPKKKTKKLIIILVVIALLGAGGYFAYQKFSTKDEQVAVTGTTTFGSLNEAIEGSGTTTPADSVTYEVMGTVLEWYVEAGQDVQEGDLLYVLDPSDAEDQLLDYEVELDDLYEDLADLQENISNQRVTADFAGRVEDITAEESQSVMNGTKLARLIDDSSMKAVLYFSYAYQGQITVGQKLTASIPDQMLNLSGTVTKINYVDYVISTGDYILTGGELAADILIDSISRLVPGVIADDSTKEESFNNGLLEYPQYTKPFEYDGKEVPEVLISGHHANIKKFQRFESLKKTYLNRPELLDNIELSKEDLKYLELIKQGKELEFNK